MSKPTIEQVRGDIAAHVEFVKQNGGSAGEIYQAEFTYNNDRFLTNQESYAVCVKCLAPHHCNCTGHSEELEKTGLCFQCLLWEKRKASDFSKDNTFISNGTMFTSGGIRGGDAKFLGHAGRRFKIVTADGRVLYSNNVWCGGELPFWLRRQIPDNAVMSEPTAAEWARACE